MRVLHLFAGNLYGGIERLLTTLARERHHAPQMDPEFACAFDGQCAHELREAGVQVHVLGGVRFSRPWTVWSARRALAGVLSARRPDVVVTHAAWPHAVFARGVRRSGTKLVYFAHDPATGKHWIQVLARRTRPDLVLANSRFTAGSMELLFPGVPCRVQYPPVSMPVLDRSPEARNAVRESVGTAKDAVVIVIACRLERWKGHMVLLEALERLHDLPGWVCWIAGGAQRPSERAYLTELEQKAASPELAGRISFLGQRDDVPKLLAAADIHCQPNTGPEPFGIAFVEALAAGLPVVTSDFGAAREIVDEGCGMLVRAGDGAEVAAALRKLIEDTRARTMLGTAAPGRAAQLCAVDVALQGLAGSVQSLL